MPDAHMHALQHSSGAEISALAANTAEPNRLFLLTTANPYDCTGTLRNTTFKQKVAQPPHKRCAQTAHVLMCSSGCSRCMMSDIIMTTVVLQWLQQTMTIDSHHHEVTSFFWVIKWLQQTPFMA
jgi:hypothetical protein